jgi:hypothetical protein
MKKLGRAGLRVFSLISITAVAWFVANHFEQDISGARRKAVIETLIHENSLGHKIIGCSITNEEFVRSRIFKDPSSEILLGDLLLRRQLNPDREGSSKIGDILERFLPTQLEVKIDDLLKEKTLVNTLVAMRVHPADLPRKSCDIWNEEIAKQRP